MVNFQGMSIEQLQAWEEACQIAVMRAKEDLSKVSGALAVRAIEEKNFLEAEPPFGYPL